MVKNSNYQDLLKLIAIFTMFVDHIGFFFFPEIMELRVIGRYAMPIFGFFVGYNFKNSINFSILLYGLILYLISVLFIWQYFIQANILISIFVGQVYLFYFQDHFKNLTKGCFHFVVLLAFFPFTNDFFDYGSIMIGIIVIGYMVKIQSINTNIASCAIIFISFFHTVVTFSSFFSNIDFFLFLLVLSAIWISIFHSNFETEISFNIKIITRHSMLIYFVHILIIQFVWWYYVIL